VSEPWVWLEELSSSGSITLMPDEARHVAARRLRVGDSLVVFDGHGRRAAARKEFDCGGRRFDRGSRATGFRIRPRERDSEGRSTFDHVADVEPARSRIMAAARVGRLGGPKARSEIKTPGSNSGRELQGREAALASRCAGALLARRGLVWATVRIPNLFWRSRRWGERVRSVGRSGPDWTGGGFQRVGTKAFA